SPVEFPDKVGKDNVNGIFSSGDWFPGSKASGSAAFTAAYLKKYGGTANDIDSTSVDAFSCGALVEQVAKKTGKVDNKTLISTLMASGQTLIFGIMKVVNLAQGALVIAAAYLTYTLFTRFGVDPFLAIVITAPVLFGLGVLVQVAFLRPLRREDAAELSLLVT